jgi:predicted small secreted protein
MKRLVLALVALGALALAGCQTPRTTSATGWGQIAVGAGQVIGETKYDAKVAKASEELDRYCGALRAVAMGATLFAPEKQRAIAVQASAAVNSVCDTPPSNVATALTAAVKAYEAVLAAGKASGVSVQSVPAGA